MASKKQSQQKYLKGSEDVQRLLETVNDEEKKARRAAWIKDNLNKQTNNKSIHNKGEYNES